MSVGSLQIISACVEVPHVGTISLVDALVCASVPAGTRLTFVLFDASWTADVDAVRLCFITQSTLVPGMVLRLRPATLPTIGTQLDAITVTNRTEGWTSVTTIAQSSAGLPVGIPTWARSCAILSGACGDGVAALAWPDTDLAGLPVPLQFVTLLSSPPEALQEYVGFSSTTGIPNTWLAAWRLLKFGLWGPSDSTGVTILTTAFWIELSAGSVAPVAVSPHLLGSPLGALLALSVLTDIVPSTMIAITSPGVIGAVWHWTSPSDETIPAGNTLLFSKLFADGAGSILRSAPCARVTADGHVVGDLVHVPAWATEDETLQTFLIWPLSPGGILSDTPIADIVPGNQVTDAMNEYQPSRVWPPGPSAVVLGSTPAPLWQWTHRIEVAPYAFWVPSSGAPSVILSRGGT